MTKKDNQDKKRWLSQYREIVAETERLVREKEEWRSIAEKVTPTYSFEPKSSGTLGESSRIATAAEHLVEIDAELEKQICKRVELRLAIASAIHSVPSEKMRYLLERRYIDGMVWERIAVDMGYSCMQIWRMHGEALSQINM